MFRVMPLGGGSTLICLASRPQANGPMRSFARRRDLLNRVSKALWGPVLEPERYVLVSWMFLRLLGAIYVSAFASLGIQIRGLVGNAGILPLADYLDAAQQALGGTAYWALPTMFWLNAGDTALVAGTVIGVLLGLLVVLDRWTRPALTGLFVLYLSYVYAGQDFMRFQWDLLLLEAGFLAIFLTGGSRIVIWLYRWLVVRYLFLAGAVKVLSGDATWRDLTALEYHFLDATAGPLPSHGTQRNCRTGSWPAGPPRRSPSNSGIVLLIFPAPASAGRRGLRCAAAPITDPAYG